MFCPKCGASLAEGAVFCHNCGYNLSGVSQDPAAAPVSPLENTKTKLQNPLFLAICILLTVSAGVGFFFGSFDVLAILIVIGVWLVYAGSTGENTNLIGSGIKVTSVSVKIGYVLTYVGAGLIILFGLLCLLIFGMIGDAVGEFTTEIYAGFEEALMENHVDAETSAMMYEFIDAFIKAITELSGVVIGVILFVATLLSAGIMILVNVLFTGRFSKYLTNVSRAYNECRPIELNERGVATRILVYGIFLGIGALSTLATGALFGFISQGSMVAACILSYILLKKAD
ncbi:MAG: zinc ribbon domain-containing protein [Ruminococcaceae bacterium]|nr:zinc ribbon domain-containing protein [Oscillospiraceae bacterium]